MSKISDARRLLQNLKRGIGDPQKVADEIVSKSNALPGQYRGLGRLGITENYLNHLVKKAKIIQKIKKYILVLCDKDMGIVFPDVFIKEIDRLVVMWELHHLSIFFTKKEIEFLNKIFSRDFYVNDMINKQ